MPKSFRNLKVWDLSMDLTMLIYALTAEFPEHEIYNLSPQMRRAAISISSNIAEGSARSTRKDLCQFVIIARGSSCELETQLMIASRLGYATTDKIVEAGLFSKEVGQMLNGLSRFLKTQPPTTCQQSPTTH